MWPPEQRIPAKARKGACVRTSKEAARPEHRGGQSGRRLAPASCGQWFCRSTVGVGGPGSTDSRLQLSPIHSEFLAAGQAAVGLQLPLTLMAGRGENHSLWWGVRQRGLQTSF